MADRRFAGLIAGSQACWVLIAWLIACSPAADGEGMTIGPGSVGIDFSGAAISPAQAHKDGATFIVRYSAGHGNTNPNSAFKLCKPDEIQQATAAGLDFIANSEWYESRVTEGATAGSQDGAADLGFWQARHLARGASIYCSWDQAPNPAQWSAVDAYLRAYHAALHGYYFVDCYAGTPYLKHAILTGVIRYGWRPNAGSWSNDTLPYQPDQHGIPNMVQARAATPAALWQTGNYWYGNGADENLFIRTHCGSHLQASALAPPVSPVKPPAVPGHPAPPAPKPQLRRVWPRYLPAGHYFGLVSGPAASHGGYYPAERPDVQAIQHRLQVLKYAPAAPGWADGIYEQPTANAVAAWQRAHYAGTTTRPGEVWSDDWAHLFTY